MMRTLSLVLVAISALAACRDSNEATSAAPPPTSAVNPEWVTGAARAALDRNGRFVLPRASAPGEIDERQAVALGDVWMREFGPLARKALEEQRRAPIDLQSLKLCDRPLYAASSYKPTDDVPLEVRQLHGSWWLLSYCNRAGEAEVSLSVSALATNVSIESGRIRFPVSHGTEFIWYGIPSSLKALPVTAERAVAAAFEATLVPVTEVPELVAPPRPNAPFSAQWHLTLAQPATLRTAEGAARSSRDLYVRYTGVVDEPTLSIAPGGQPAAGSFKLPPAVSLRMTASGRVERITTPGATPAPRAWTIARRSDRPLVFERVTGMKEVRP